jgi:putative tryptophan/tyrosine transport system substrate-binding protein
MSKKVFCLALGALLFALCSVAEAQKSAKIPRIGFLSSTSASTGAHNFEAFREGLRELGYVDGKTSPLSTDGRRESSTACPTSPRSL